MKIKNLSLPGTSQFIHDYVLGKEEAKQFFGYAPYDLDSYRDRLEYLQSRNYHHRDQLVDGLHTYNSQIGNHQEAFMQIEKLRHKDAYVVVAGQQAGLLTGPLYTIHKAVQVIQTARRLEKELGVFVVPVFWIAGEDHDLDEIDHIFTVIDDTRLDKIKIKVKKQGKPSASMLEIDAEAMLGVVEQFLAGQGETVHTPKLRQLLIQTAKESKTLVDWFAKLMVHFFGKHGLVMLESSSPFIRELEKPLFRKVIEHNEEISNHLLAAERSLLEKGYKGQLVLDRDSANLFIYENGDRLLVERTADGFQTKDTRYAYTKEQLIEMLENTPDKFSANVATRPLMQEHLLPTLAFIGGPGELAYWAFFKEYFSYMGYQLPICLPRTSISLTELALERKMELLDLTIETVLGEFDEWKQNWIHSLDDLHFNQSFEDAKKEIVAIYQPIAKQVVAYDEGLKQLVAKNVNKLVEQVNFLQDRTQKSILEKHGVTKKRVERIETNLIPNGQLQERVLTIFEFVNTHGEDLVDRLVEANVSFDATHKVVYL